MGFVAKAEEAKHRELKASTTAGGKDEHIAEAAGTSHKGEGESDIVAGIGKG